MIKSSRVKLSERHLRKEEHSDLNVRVTINSDDNREGRLRESRLDQNFFKPNSSQHAWTKESN